MALIPYMKLKCSHNFIEHLNNDPSHKKLAQKKALKLSLHLALKTLFVRLIFNSEQG
jgi:hypothetical protein